MLRTRTPRPFVVRSSILTGTAVLLLAATAAHGTVWTVGNDTEVCDFSDLQTALDALRTEAATEKVLRIADDRVYYANELEIIDTSLTLQGGFPTCAASAPTGRTLLTGTFAAPVISIESADPADHVILRNVSLRSGGGAFGGGVSATNADLTLDDVEISVNFATDSGGGIYATGGSVLTIRNSSIWGNETDGSGGGIACSNCTLRMLGNNSITDNDAFRDGGGLSVKDSPKGEIRGAHDIGYNHAARGGGLHVESELVLASTSSGPIEIHHNGATLDPGVFYHQRGGGISVVGADAFLDGVGLRIENNTLLDDASTTMCGGGIAVNNGAQAVLRSEGLPSTLRGNRGLRGSAACVKDGDSRLEIFATAIESNGPVVGTTYFVIEAGFNGDLLVEGSTFWDNEAPTLVRLQSDGHVDLAHITVAGNRSGLFNVLTVIDYQDRIGSAAIQSSIVWELAGVRVFNAADGATVSAECLITSELDSLTENGLAPEHVLLGNPGLADGFGGNLHLRDDSPAIDFCDGSNWTPLEWDIDDGVRGFDDPTMPDRVEGSHFDVGADEYLSAQSAVLFIDGFETGDTSGWN